MAEPKSTVRIRRPLQDLQNEYEKGNKEQLENLMRAWKGIKELPQTDPNSFFVIGGYHGEPFRGGGWGDSKFWGGYCNHGNILFPTWHRMYLVRLEEALQSIPGCADVMQPYWDETSEDSLSHGIPWALTQKDFVLDGQTIPNPLRSYVFPRGIKDHLSPFPDTDYSKPKGYETVRYPLSGLVGTDADKAATLAHNAMFPDHAQNVELLNQNVVNWLTSAIVVEGKVIPTHVKKAYEDCLDAPNYTLFSNTTSAAQYFDETGEKVVPLESPHNKIHLSVGGFEVPGQGNFSPIPDANADMGENDTAGLDPIFFFHHCFVDRVFWLWQKRNGYTDHLDLIPEYPGTNSVDNQGPTPGTVPNSWLTLESPLDPFKKQEGGKLRAYMSLDCINIEKQLGYTYGPGSLESQGFPQAAAAIAAPAPVILVGGINRNRIRGSFLICAFANIDGKRHLLGTEAVLSRWHVQGCANCQTHVEARAFVDLYDLHPGIAAASASSAIEVEVRTRGGVLDRVRMFGTAGVAHAASKAFRVEIRRPHQAAESKSCCEPDKPGKFPAVGHRYFVDFRAFKTELFFASETSLTYTGVKPDGSHGNSETVNITVEPIESQLFLVTWQESDKTTVVHLEDYDRMTIITNITNPDGSFEKYHGKMTLLS